MEAQLSGTVGSDDELSRWIGDGRLRGCTSVCVWHAGLTDRGARAIAEARDGGELVYLDVSWNRIRSDGAHALVTSPALERMTRLRLYHNDVGVDGAAAIAQGGARLAMVNLCGNQLGDRGVAALADGRLAQLHELALGWNDLGGDAVRAIVAGPWRQLEMLNIRANRLGPPDVALLVSGALPALHWLGVDENPLGAAGLAALLDGPGFERLQWLNLGGTELDDRAIAQLTAWRQRGRPCALRELRLHDNELSRGAIAELRAALPGCEVRA